MNTKILNDQNRQLDTDKLNAAGWQDGLGLKVPAVEPNSLSLIPGTHTTEGEK